MNRRVISIHELCETVLAGTHDLTETRERIIAYTAALLDGSIEVVSADGIYVPAARALEKLANSLDFVCRAELVAAADSHISFLFASPQATDDPAALANGVRVATSLLRGRRSFHEAVTLSAKILRESSLYTPEVTVAAANALLDAGQIGNDPTLWTNLCTPSPANLHYFRPAVLALLEKWPLYALEFLLEEAAKMPMVQQEELASFVRLVWRDVTGGVPLFEYARRLAKANAALSTDLIDSFIDAGALRGWDVPAALREHVEHDAAAPGDSELPLIISQAENFTTLSELSALAAYGGGSMRALQTLQPRAIKLAHDVHYDVVISDSLSRGFPATQLDVLSTIRAGVADNPRLQESTWVLEVAFVRESVRIDLDEQSARGDIHEPEILLDAVENCVPHHYYAKQAEKSLAALGFSTKPFYLGASEYHQDRLQMAIVAAALRRAGLMGAQVARRAWDDRSLRLLRKDNANAHVVMRGHLQGQPTASGIFRFRGFRVFIRADELRRQGDRSADDSMRKHVNRLLSAVEEGIAVRDALDLGTRAALALHFGDLNAKGSAFEELRGALQIIAGVARSPKRVATIVSNDDAFERFISGRSAVYCGGSINSLLIDTWWGKIDPGTFIELLDHDEIEKGFVTVGRSGTKGRRRYVENALEFGDLGASFDTGAVRSARRALTSLFRAVGQGLQLWAADVTGHVGPLNGLTESCHAARRILRPLSWHRAGQYAFATTLSDAAQLVDSSDEFYTIEGTLPG